MNSETPILDLQAPWPIKLRISELNWWQSVVLITSILSAIPLGFAVLIYFPQVVHIIRPFNDFMDTTVNHLADSMLESPVRSAFHVFFFIGIFILSPIVATLIHELGHVLGAKIAGFSVARFDVGPFVMEKLNSLWKFRIQKSWLVDGLVVPQFQIKPGHRKKMIMFVAAGPVASLLLAILIGSLILNSTAHGNVRIFFYILFLYTSAQLITSILPIQIKGFAMDGLVLKSLIIGGQLYKRVLILSYIGKQLLSGVRPRYWNKRWVKQSLEVKDGSLYHLLAVYYAYNWAYDSKMGEVASSYLEQLLASPYRLSVMDSDKLAVEAGIYQAWFRQDKVKAQVWQERMVAKNRLNESDLVRGVLINLWIQGEKAELQRILDDRLSTIQKMPPSDLREMILCNWIEFREELLSKQFA